MKTKFSELLKVKKQKLSEVERALAQKRHERAQLVEQSALIRSRIETFSPPKSGDYRQMRMALHSREYLFKEKERNANMIKYYDQEIAALQQLYKEANIDYEKINHLHTLEVEQRLKERMRQEAKDMDEIAGQLFFIERMKEVD